MNMTEHLYETFTASTEGITSSMNMTEYLYETFADSTEDITTSASIETIDSMEDTDEWKITIDNTKSYASTNSTDDDDNTASFIFINSTKHISDRTSADNQAKTLKVKTLKIDFEEYDNLEKLISVISRNHQMFLIVPNTVLSKQKSTLKSAINQKSFKTNEDIAIPILTKQKLEKKDHIRKNKHDKKPQTSKKCIFMKAAMKTAKDSTHKSNSSTDDQPYIEAEQSMHSATHTDDDIINPELPDNQEETIEESPPKCPADQVILGLSFLFVALQFLFFSSLFHPFGHSLLDQNLEHTDTFKSIIVELEEKILDQDETIRSLTKYLQQDTPLLKVVALINNASVDKYTIQNTYTIDIIKNKFARRSGNESVYPSFTVLENLSLKNSKVVIDYVDMCQRAYPPDQQVTILADFIIDDDLTHIDLNQVINTFKTTFTRANINIKILLYKPLNDETLEKYIKNEAGNIGKSFSQIQINDIKRHLIESKKPMVITRK